MRNDWITGPGRCEGQPPIVAFLVERVSPEVDGGDVSLGGSYDLMGKWVLTWDEQGFVVGSKYPSRAQAAAAFEAGCAEQDHYFKTA